MATKEKSKKAKKTDELNVVFIWDMSGSMGMIEAASRGSTAEYLKGLQKDEKKLAKKKAGTYTRLSLTAFDTEFEQWTTGAPVLDCDVEALVGRWQPRGFTALFDAIGNTVTQTASRMQKEGRADEKVLVIIMTDGAENASREWNRERIQALITEYEARGNWTFIYLGANVDAYTEAGAMGIARGNTASYASTDSSVAVASAGLSNVTRTRRSHIAGQTLSAFADAGEVSDYRDADEE